MRLDSNALTGSLPAWNASSLPNLVIFRAFLNQLEGTLPVGLGQLPNLQILSLQNNTLSGTLPGSWELPSLHELYLSSNRLEGHLPADWGSNGTFSSLQILELQSNSFSGSLPGDWGDDGRFPRLSSINALNSSLSGTLPDAWGTTDGLGALTSLTLSYNGLSGTIPASWSQLPSLQYLVIRPGNEDLCAALPSGSSIQFCSVVGYGCSSIDTVSTQDANCTAPPPADTGSGFPVAAVVAPIVSVVGVIAIGGAIWLRRRRRRQSAPVDAAPKTVDVEAAVGAPVSGDGPPTSGGGSAGRRPSGPAGTGSSLQSLSSSQTPISVQIQSRYTTSLDPTWSGGESPLHGAASYEPQLRSFLDSESSEADALGSGASRLPKLAGISDWEVQPSEIEIVRRADGSPWKLGSGGFGTVFKALRHGVQPVAVKVVTSPNDDVRGAAMEDFVKEISILKACRDINIVQFVGASLTPDNTMLVTEYCEGGNLCNNIAAGRVTWYRRGAKVALDVAKALVFLHSRRIVHFDLKSPNILLTRDGTAKISDVGMAKILARDYVSGAVGTLAWAAPEMLWGDRCTEKADIYSYGIVLWEICTGERPVRGQLREVIVPDECPALVRALIFDCLQTRPTKRPSALQIVERLQAEAARGHGESDTPSDKAPGTKLASPANAVPSPANRRPKRGRRSMDSMPAPDLKLRHASLSRLPLGTHDSSASADDRSAERGLRPEGATQHSA